ncbi:MAG: DNA repair protein RecO [Balneola sp.]|nr:MAG: DNA repair protein RecO [Balneola sp.]
MITHTQVIVLRTVDYQESSKIITVLSKEHGKIALIARGAKKPKNKLRGALEIGNILDVVYYHKPSRSVQNLTEASIHFSSQEFRIDLEKASILYTTLELVAQLIHENEMNESFYKFLITLIPWLAGNEAIKASILCYIQVRCAELCGFLLNDENTNLEMPVYFNIAEGSISNAIDSELSYKLTVLQARFLKQSIQTKQKNIFNIELTGQELKQLIRHLDVYFMYHIEGFKERKSDVVFEQLLKDS